MTIATIFGGRSSEHDISIITAVQTMAHLAKAHTLIPIYITPGGVMLTGRDFDKLETFASPPRGKEVGFRPASHYLHLASGKKLKKIDAAILCLHGMGGEDGTVAGVLELAGIPYTGSNLRASAVGMDKITLKHVLKGVGIPVTRYLGINKYDYIHNAVAITDQIRAEFAFPLIVKPSNLGSSIGISLANDFVELFSSLKTAFEWDTRVIIEEALQDFTELNCAVIGYGDEYIVSEVEQPIGWKSFLSFEDKYEGGFKGTASRKFPADIPNSLRAEVQHLAKQTFRAIDASGVARIDFLLKDDSLYVNEINTIPGSLSNYLFPDQTFQMLLEKLIALALKQNKDKTALTYTFKPTKLITKNTRKLK